MTERTAANLVRTLVFVWSLLFVLSVIFALSAEKTGSGFTRGVNRVETFFLWQFIALGVAVVSGVCARLARAKVAKPVRGLGYLPLTVHLLLGVVLLGIALAAVLLA